MPYRSTKLPRPYNGVILNNTQSALRYEEVGICSSKHMLKGRGNHSFLLRWSAVVWLSGLNALVVRRRFILQREGHPKERRHGISSTRMIYMPQKVNRDAWQRNVFWTVAFFDLQVFYLTLARCYECGKGKTVVALSYEGQKPRL